MSREPSAFRAALATLDAEARLALVAAVYDARGWASEPTDGAVLVHPPGEPDARRLVAPPRPGDDPPPIGTRVDRELDTEDLREMLAYALDEGDRTRLCRRFFDRDAAELGLTGGGRHAAGGADDADVPSVSLDSATPSPDGVAVPSAVAAVLVAVVAVSVAVVVGPALTATDAPGDSDDGGVNADTGPAERTLPTEAADADDPAEDPDAAQAVVDLRQLYPPGVDSDGVENASALVTAHERGLSATSYRLTVVHREFVDGRPTAVAWERTAVESPERYRSTVRVDGTFQRNPRAVANASTYANGTVRTVRVTGRTDPDGTIRFTESAESGVTPDTRVVGDVSGTDPFADRTVTYLRRVLAVSNATVDGSFVRNGTRFVWLDLSRQPMPGTDVSGTILVDEQGLVHEIRYERVETTIGSVPLRTVVTLRIRAGNVTASPPPWVDAGA